MPSYNIRTPDPSSYQMYLLLCWQSQQNGEIVWRASLEEARTGTRYGFANLEALYEFLKVELGVNTLAAGGGRTKTV